MIKFGKFIFLSMSIVYYIHAIADTRLIIKYKPDASQLHDISAGLLSHKQLNAELMQPLSTCKIANLSKAAGMKVIDSHAIATGAHVLILENDVSKDELQNIIDKIKHDTLIDYVEDDSIIKATDKRKVK